MSGVPVYGMQVECMAYCYGGSPALEVDEYPDASDPHAVVKYADHVAALAECEERVWEKFPAALSSTSVQSMSIYGQGLREGFLSAIDAAEAAVAAMPLTGGWTTPEGVIEEIDKAKTIAAIDALRKEN